MTDTSKLGLYGMSDALWQRFVSTAFKEVGSHTSTIWSTRMERYNDFSR